ncbi:phosphotransferase family protein [Ophiostoma piceae UAMH 11346]|uniref:Phosphotransferase family protein n=1 Tax=Ophiostoma piceae (strain UAMH 11346) TaxID=1262450 RepID=S3CM27_OPHP1|nr:phosphotransferase family protein [Ophiostoma piceae UAMH 11346]
MMQAAFQCRDDVLDADDARDKYVARQLFRKLAANKRPTDAQTAGQPYTLFSEDFRPENKPEDFSSSPGAWLEQCEPYMQTFLRLLEEAEAEQANKQDNVKDKDNGLTLSQRMRANWTSRRWMVEYAARTTWVFDHFWWKYIDKSCFGENEDEDHKERLVLLTDVQREQLEPFVAKKLLMTEEKEILQCTDEDVQRRLQELLI